MEQLRKMELRGAWQLQQSVGKIIVIKKKFNFQNAINGILKLIITF